MSETQMEGGPEHDLGALLIELGSIQQRVYDAISSMPLIAHIQDQLEAERSSSERVTDFVAKVIGELAVTRSQARIHSLFPENVIQRRYLTDLQTTMFLDGPALINTVRPHILWAPLLLNKPAQRETVFPSQISYEEKGFDQGLAKVQDGQIKTELFPESEIPYGTLPFMIIGARVQDKRFGEILLALPPLNFGYLQSRTSFYTVLMNNAQWLEIKALQESAISPPSAAEVGAYYNVETRQFEMTASSPGIVLSEFNSPIGGSKIDGTTRKHKLSRLPLLTSPITNPFLMLQPDIIESFGVMPRLANLAQVFGKAEIFGKLMQDSLKPPPIPMDSPVEIPKITIQMPAEIVRINEVL